MNAGKHNLNNRHLHIAFQVSLLLVAFSLFTFGCDKADEEPIQPVQEAPQQILSTFSTQHADGGITEWALVAEKATFLKEIVELQKTDGPDL